MLDIQFIRENAELVAEKSKQKGYEVDIKKLVELDERRRGLLTQIEQLRAKRNQQAAEVKNQKPSEEQIAAGKQLKEQISALEAELTEREATYDSLLKQVPNLPLDDVPVGKSEDENVVVKEWGVKKDFDFKPKTHWELAEPKDWIDKERAAKVAGSRFAYLKGDLVNMQFALICYVMKVLQDETVLQQLIEENGLNLTAKPFMPILPPAMVRTAPYEASARLDAEDVTYKLADDDLWLNASAEHALCTMYMDEILAEDSLPIRYIGYSTSFRREAGTYGKDMEGIIRMHQFDKLEMEVFSTPETGVDEHKLLIAIQEYLVQQLELPYQLIHKCTADIGKPNARGVDINIWMPGQGKYTETHTADYMTDYQARRLKTRLRRGNGTVHFIHTNDATAFALGRILVAIMENYQTTEGNVLVPEILKPYI